MFKALVLDKSEGFRAEVREVEDSFLPEGDVTMAVDYSTLNYKDGLAITNRLPIVRSWPMVAGIDGAGTVTESQHPAWKPGDRVILNGFGVAETHKGCLAAKARLKKSSQLFAREVDQFGNLVYGMREVPLPKPRSPTPKKRPSKKVRKTRTGPVNGSRPYFSFQSQPMLRSAALVFSSV